MVKEPGDLVEAKQEGLLAVSYMFQGTNPLEKNLGMIDLLYKLGVRSMIVSYNIRNAMGDGCAEENDAGLSLLGKKLVTKMNSAGMLIDCSHTGYKTSMDVMRLSIEPVIFSHSNVHSIHSHPRNLTDEQIIASANTGGFIGINGNGMLLGDDDASITKYVDHIEYIINLVGDDHVSLGTDLIYFPEIFDQFMQKNAVLYPGNYEVKSIEQWKSVQPEHLPEIIAEMDARGFSEDTIKKVLGENYLRVIQKVWK